MSTEQIRSHRRDLIGVAIRWRSATTCLPRTSIRGGAGVAISITYGPRSVHTMSPLTLPVTIPIARAASIATAAICRCAGAVSLDGLLAAVLHDVTARTYRGARSCDR